jgi:hypothetical protein
MHMRFRRLVFIIARRFMKEEEEWGGGGRGEEWVGSWVDLDWG